MTRFICPTLLSGFSIDALHLSSIIEIIMHATPHMCTRGDFKKMVLYNIIVSKYESSLINDFAFSKSYKIYEYIKSLKKEDSLPPTVFNSNSSATDDSDKASLFNEYFDSVFTTGSYRLPPLDEIDTPTSVVTNIVLSDSDVYSALTSLDQTKSSGTDGIGPKLLKVEAIALYIYTSPPLFKLCLSKCSIPSEWKIHRIIPIFKAGDKTSVQNYRPTSLLCYVSEVLERLIFTKISDFVTRQISPSQFVFLRGHSSVQQLLKFLSLVIDSLDNSLQCDDNYI